MAWKHACSWRCGRLLGQFENRSRAMQLCRGLFVLLAFAEANDKPKGMELTKFTRTSGKGRTNKIVTQVPIEVMRICY